MKCIKLPTTHEIQREQRKELRHNSLLLIASIAIIIGGTVIELSGYF